MARDREALGRSRGGLGTKIVGICDAAGRLVDFMRTPGQAHELAPSLKLLRGLSEAPFWAIAHMACDAAQFRSEARDMDAIPVVPSRRGAKEPQPCPAHIYRYRNQIERCWSRLKERRAVATRDDKTAVSYAGRGHRRLAGLDQVFDPISAKCERTLAHFGRSCQNAGDKWQRQLNALIHEANIKFKPIDVEFGQVRLIQKNDAYVGLQYPASGLRGRTMLMFEVVATRQVTVCLSNIGACSPPDADGPFPKTHIAHALAHFVRLAALA